ncbi:MAG TPA: tRNA-dihydrouridine synthase [Patescibacteria group bacterium]|nr:tRNA-dihydrouridine synthase [Patescibacteria group bacterium]
MKSIWKTIATPIFILAPMEDVSDTVFRQIVASCARPDIFFTEFTNVDGIQSAGHDVVANRLKYADSEHPIVAQVWGKRPENYYRTAQELVSAGFDGIDINMGCPEKKVVAHGGCAALIKNPSLGREIILATKEGAGRKIPVSVKTRIGFQSIATEEWISFLLSLDIAALTVHGRTAAEMSKVPAHWDEIGKAVAIRNQMKVNTLIIGNGDVVDATDGLTKVKKYHVDGIMIGRGIFENPWAFDRIHPGVSHSIGEHMNLMRRHIELFTEVWGKKKPYAILKKFFKIYLRGFDGASQWRMRVMETKKPEEVYPIIEEMLKFVR